MRARGCVGGRASTCGIVRRRLAVRAVEGGAWTGLTRRRVAGVRRMVWADVWSSCR